MYDRHLALRYKPLTHTGAKLRLQVTNNLAGWWRYKLGYTIANGRVNTWADQSGHARNFVNATTGPAVGGDGGLLFTGVGSSDGLTALTWGLAQPCTIYLAVQQVSWTANANILTGTANSVRLQQTSASPELDFNDSSGGSIVSTAVPVGVYSVIALVANGASSVYQTSAGTGTFTNTGTLNTNSLGGLNLGFGRFGIGVSNIAVREVICYSVAHDAQTRLTVLKYLARIANVGGV